MLAARGIRAASLSVRENKFGKPEFDPSLGLHFSISHSDGRVMVALSDRPVGCDVERIAPVQAEVLAEGLAPDERTAVEALADGRERDQAFCRLWTRKESYVKACGCGFSCDPKTISTLQDVVRTDFAFQDFEYEDGYMGCVCQRIRSACCAGDGTR